MSIKVVCIQQKSPEWGIILGMRDRVINNAEKSPCVVFVMVPRESWLLFKKKTTEKILSSKATEIKTALLIFDLS